MDIEIVNSLIKKGIESGLSFEECSKMIQSEHESVSEYYLEKVGWDYAISPELVLRCIQTSEFKESPCEIPQVRPFLCDVDSNGNPIFRGVDGWGQTESKKKKLESLHETLIKMDCDGIIIGPSCLGQRSYFREKASELFSNSSNEPVKSIGIWQQEDGGAFCPTLYPYLITDAVMTRLVDRELKEKDELQKRINENVGPEWLQKDDKKRLHKIDARIGLASQKSIPPNEYFATGTDFDFIASDIEWCTLNFGLSALLECLNQGVASLPFSIIHIGHDGCESVPVAVFE